MTKKEIEEQIKKERNLKFKNFIDFINENEFITEIDEWGNFNENEPIYYKKIIDKIFLLFSVSNIQKKNYTLAIDLFEIIADYEYDFLENNDFISNKLIFSFDLDRDKEIFFSKISSYRT